MNAQDELERIGADAYSALAEMVAALGRDVEGAEERIQEDPLSLRIFGERINGEWSAESFELLLTTGGPAVRIVGYLDQYGEPSDPKLEVQDWGTPWTAYDANPDLLLDYCRCFYFGE